MRRFFSVSSPFYSGDGAGAGAIGQGAGGSGAIDDGQGSGQGAGSGAGAGSGSVIDLTPDHMIRVPGSKDPVKFSDWQKGYIPQSEFTKKAQTLAKERQDFERERNEATQKLVEEARKIAAARGGGRQEEDPLAELRNANYIDGKTAAGMLEAIQARGIKPIIDAIGQRDEVIKELHKQVTGLSGLVNKMQQASGQSALGERFKSVGKNLGLPEDPSVHEWLADLYASHEGDDWDQNFETTAKSRIEGLRKALREADRKQAAEAKRKLITGAGGSGTPGKKLNEGFKKPSDIANSFAEALGIPD